MIIRKAFVAITLLLLSLVLPYYFGVPRLVPIYLIFFILQWKLLIIRIS